MRKKLLTLLGCVGLMQLNAQNAVNIKFTEYDMPNGLHVILHEDHTTPTVVVSVLYHVGSKNEDAQRTGFAHFFEHLMFEGSTNIARGDYMKLVQGNGGVLNANTSFDRTYYFQQMPSNLLETALWMEAERMVQLNVDSVGIETQRGVVKEEKKQRYENTPYGHLFEQIFANSYKQHPYRWTPIGEAQYIDKAKYSEFMDFYKTFYVPNNATLVIAGDINVENAKRMAKKYFSTIPKGIGAIPRNITQEPQQTAENRAVYYDKIQLPACILSYHGPAQGKPDSYPMALLSKILSDGKSSRMYKEIVDNKQIAVQAAAFNINTEDPGLVAMFGIANMGKSVEELEKALDEEVDKLLANGITDEELAKAKNQVENDFINQNSRLMGVAENLADYHVYYGNANLINTELDRYMTITKDDVMRVAKQYLQKTNRTVLHYLPKK